MREKGFDRIVTVTVDVGQSPSDLAQAQERAKVLGTEHHTVDVREEFASEYCMAALSANADYFGYPLSTAIARPLIAKRAAELGQQLGVDAFVHGCTGKGNDQFRIEFGLRCFAPETPILAPIRERNLTRSWEIAYAEKMQLPIGQSAEKIWSIDENLWGRSIEGGELEDPAQEPPEEIFAWTASSENSPSEPEYVKIVFQKGIPIHVESDACASPNSIKPHEAIQIANSVGGKHGVGRIDILEERILGLKVRENYECPGATILIAAHRALESLVMTSRERTFKTIVDAAWADLAYQGLWWDPLMDDLNCFIGAIQKRVEGEVKLKLHKGSAKVVSRKSPWAVYSLAEASFEDDQALVQSDFTGIVKAHGNETLLYRRQLEDHRNASN